MRLRAGASLGSIHKSTGSSGESKRLHVLQGAFLGQLLLWEGGPGFEPETELQSTRIALAPDREPPLQRRRLPGGCTYFHLWERTESAQDTGRDAKPAPESGRDRETAFQRPGEGRAQARATRTAPCCGSSAWPGPEGGVSGCSPGVAGRQGPSFKRHGHTLPSPLRPRMTGA